MLYKEYKPCDGLKKYIKCFWITEREYSKDFALGDIEYLWPSALTEILYVTGPNFTLLNDMNEITLPDEMVIGAYNRKFVLKNNGHIRIVGIRCYNHGANLLFGLDLNNIKNTIIEFNIEGIDKGTLNSDNKESIIEELNTYCKKLIKEDEFVDLLYKLYKEESLSLEELSREANLSLRQFERRIKKLTSFTPKELTTIIRFDKARIKMLFNKDYLQIMHDLGYYDYSHFSKDFKKYYDIIPKQFINIYNKQFN